MDLSSAVDHLQNFGPHLVYLAVYAMLLLSAMGMPLPEDLTLVATGYLINLREQLKGHIEREYRPGN